MRKGKTGLTFHAKIFPNREAGTARFTRVSKRSKIQVSKPKTIAPAQYKFAGERETEEEEEEIV